MMKTSSFHYDLPEKLIAQHPAARRDASRLMLLDGETGNVEHKIFSDLPDFLSAGDCLVLNNTRVIPARLIGCRSDSRTPVEVVLLRRLSADVWETIVRPGRRIRQGHQLEFIPNRLTAEVQTVKPDGNRLLRFSYEGTFEAVLDEAGQLPLPPYIHEKLEDPERYQTVYACHSGSAAAPTAGLHFTPELLAAIRARGVTTAELTLHVGLGTFRPVKAASIENHEMHAEYFTLPANAVDAINKTRKAGGRIVAVGTTTTRVLESVAARFPELKPLSGSTDIFIYPGFKFKIVDRLITNFHLPESTLIMLVSAFAGLEAVMAAYKEAVACEYRFFSFGDAMLLSRRQTPEPGVELPNRDFCLNITNDLNINSEKEES